MAITIANWLFFILFIACCSGFEKHKTLFELNSNKMLFLLLSQNGALHFSICLFFQKERNEQIVLGASGLLQARVMHSAWLSPSAA